MQRMNETVIHIYSDASFSKQTQTAVAGFLLFENDDSHMKNEASQPVHTRVFEEKNNIRAELRGVILALEILIEKLDAGASVKNYPITLYTDCQSVVRLPSRRKGLESSDFISKKTRKPLSNADLYKQFFTLYDKVAPDIFWVKGHCPKRGRTQIQRNFSCVDKTVRKMLRDACSRSHRSPSN